MGRTRPIEERFFEKVGPFSKSGCIPWLGATNPQGYGHIWFEGKVVAAPRVAWILAKRDIPEGLWVLHRCDNPLCVNVDHLFLGTVLDNNRDCIKKGRNAKVKSEDQGRTLLTPGQVLEIRQSYLPTKRGYSLKKGEHMEFSQGGLASKFRVSRGCIQAIVEGRNWRRLK